MHEACVFTRDDAAQDEKESAGLADIKITVTVTVATSEVTRERLRRQGPQGIVFVMPCLFRDVLLSSSVGIAAARMQVILPMVSSTSTLSVARENLRQNIPNKTSSLSSPPKE